MTQRHQRGWLKKEKRIHGETWVLFFRNTRRSDGKRMENKVPIGLVQNLPNEDSWGNRIALGNEPLEVEQWLKSLKSEEKLANPTLDRHAPCHVNGLSTWATIRFDSSKPGVESDALRSCRTTSGYEAMILSPEQAYAIVRNLSEPERTLTMLATGTGLRTSECLGLQWQDVNFGDSVIHLRTSGRATGHSYQDQGLLACCRERQRSLHSGSSLGSSRSPLYYQLGPSSDPIFPRKRTERLELFPAR